MNCIRSASFLLLMALGLVFLGLSGCVGGGKKQPVAYPAGQTAPPAGSDFERQSAGNVRYAMVTKLDQDPYAREICAGAVKAADELGVSFSCKGPKQADAGEQARMVKQLVQSGISGIAIAADDGLTLSDVGKAAKQAGISVVSFDSQVNADARTLHIRPAPHSLITYELLRLASITGGHNATIAILAGAPKASDQKKLVRRLLDLLDTATFSGLRNLNVVYGNDAYEKSYNEAFGLIHENPDLQVLVCTTPTALQAAAQAAQDSLRLRNKTAVIGIGAVPSVVRAVQQGYVPSIVYWSPRNLGYLTLYALHAVKTKQTDGSQGQTFQAGCLGTFQVEDEGFVIMGRPQIYDWKNVDTLNLTSPACVAPSGNF